MLPGSPPPTTLRPRVSAVAPSSTSALSASSAARPTYMTSSTYANARAICSRSRATPGASSVFPLFAPATLNRPVSLARYADARVLGEVSARAGRTRSGTVTFCTDDPADDRLNRPLGLEAVAAAVRHRREPEPLTEQALRRLALAGALQGRAPLADRRAERRRVTRA